MYLLHKLQTEIDSYARASCGDEDTVLGNTSAADGSSGELCLKALVTNCCSAAEKSLVSEYGGGCADSADKFIVCNTVVYGRLYIIRLRKIESSRHTTGENYHFKLIGKRSFLSDSVGHNRDSVRACYDIVAYADCDDFFACSSEKINRSDSFCFFKAVGKKNLDHGMFPFI